MIPSWNIASDNNEGSSMLVETNLNVPKRDAGRNEDQGGTRYCAPTCVVATSIDRHPTFQAAYSLVYV